MDISAWAQERFGDVAAPLRDIVLAAIPQAHRDSLDAQVNGRSKRRDTYGHNLKNRQHECLVEGAREVEGIEVIHPAKAGYDLLRVPATGCVLFPWRYGRDHHTRRQDARMKPSEVKRNLLGAVTDKHVQQTLDELQLDDAELAEHFADEREQADVLHAIQAANRVVVIGYASTPEKVRELGWGDATLLEDGTVTWQHWESLPLDEAEGLGGADGSGAPAQPLRPVPSPADVRPPAPRFDDAPLDDFSLSPRTPGAGEPQQEPQEPAPQTGTEDETP